ncbi:MAG: cytochrome c class [Prolixibacteraceae bacterium]|nr:MAG: cytochrome c class [Prolixibacteraceae bacterium]
MNRKISFLTIVTLFLSVQANAQDWPVPADQNNRVNPQEYNLANVNKGKDLYLKNCKSCHGDPGKNNALPLVPPPVDVTSDKMQKNTEGGLYYKITNGRGAMPQFKTTISDDDRWKIVNYISNFSPKKQPLLVDAPPVKAKLLASVNERERKVEVFAESENNGIFTKLPNTPITVSTKKAFGNIEMGKVLTDENGRAEFVIPETVIGDEQGNVNIVVSLDDNYIADIVTLDKAKVGQLKPTPKLIQKGILWSTNENIQIWLLFSYIAAAGGAWLTIGYIVFQIAKIKRLSKE